MQEIEFELKTEYIQLIQLLKATNIANSGGQAKLMVEDEMVKRNGEVETRKRAKLVCGDVIEFEDFRITLISPA